MPYAFSASGFIRAYECPPSFALPSVDRDTKEKRRGQARHRFLALIADGIPREDALAELTPEERAECEGINTQSVPVGGETEVPLAFDVATGTARRMVIDGQRQYEVTDTEIPGTADLILWPQDHGRLSVVDWKGCFWGQEPEEVDAQLSCYALMAARVAGVDDAECRVGTVSDDGSLAWRSFVLDWEDLAMVAERIRKAFDRIQTERQRAQNAGYIPSVKMGKHCRYCSAKVYCPAQRAAVSMLVGGQITEVTPANLAEAYDAVLAAEQAADWVRAVARNLIADSGPVPLSGGRVLTLNSRKHLSVRRSA